MRTFSFSVRILAAAVALLTSQGAFAELTPLAKPGDPKLVVFPYDANNSFKVLTRPRAVTHIELLPDERVRVLALGDTVSWIASSSDNHVFIKPVYAKQTVAGTLVTTKRVYQLVFVSGTEDSHFYQHVSFQYPDLIALQARQSDLDALGAEEPKRGRESVEQRSEPADVSPDVSNLNFNYDFEGNASFKPAQVYDDGRNTYIRFGPKVVDLPALFRLREGTAVELVEYTNQGNVLIVPRVLEGGLLKLGDAEVRFRNLATFKKTWFGRYERAEK